jgi:hypothetical protein
VTAAVLDKTCIGCVPVNERRAGVSWGICPACALDAIEAAGGVTLHPAVPAVRASGGDAAPAPQRVCQTARCSSCEQHWDPREMWYGRCPVCRAQDKPFTEPVIEAGSWEDEQWVEW